MLWHKYKHLMKSPRGISHTPWDWGVFWGGHSCLQGCLLILLNPVLPYPHVVSPLHLPKAVGLILREYKSLGLKDNFSKYLYKVFLICPELFFFPHKPQFSHPLGLLNIIVSTRSTEIFLLQLLSKVPQRKCNQESKLLFFLQCRPLSWLSSWSGRVLQKHHGKTNPLIRWPRYTEFL